MKILIDTQLLLWAAEGRLFSSAAEYILDETNDLLFSSASIWEIVIKNGLGRADFSVDPKSLYFGLLDNDYNELHVTSGHALLTGSMPAIHKDPFDRVLLAQSVSEGVPILTTDSMLAKYPANVILLKK